MHEYVRAGITLLSFDLLAKETGALHAITTRVGGESLPPFESLNLGLNVGDVRECVVRNYQLVSKALGIELDSFATCKQVHGDRVIEVTEKDEAKGPFSHYHEEADAMITKVPGPVLMVRVADCIPVLFFDPVQKVIGIAHAGWRGTVKEIAAKTAEVIVSRYNSDPARILVGIGPGIGPCCYEVDERVSSLFTKGFSSGEQLITERNGKQYLDLWEANRRQLLEVGIRAENIEVAGLCTSCQNQLLFSHRKDKGKTGRFGALIGIKE
ncbi:MAG: peptidoglycan editing factor PgeF [Proteobacteria bacterium]|nr:peptidoglycan editing factor PgeF [Pseudomonadota bacterium]